MRSAQDVAKPVTEVAAAVIERPDGRFLLAQRPAGKPYEGYWEFPGGKIEAGESPLTALSRELDEELGITIARAYPWITRVYAYTHATVRLHFFRVVQWKGDPHGRENQAFEWQSPSAPTVSPMLPANAPILAAQALPKMYAISNAAELGDREFLRRLDAVLEGGLKLIQFREKTMDAAKARSLFDEVLLRAHAQGARVLVNSAHRFAHLNLADGIHLTGADLAAATARSGTGLCAASCHDAAGLAQAAKLGCDFAVLGPVNASLSHPQGEPLGWQRAGALIAALPMPVYALGGMRQDDLAIAWEHGAHGIASMRAVWNQ